MVASLTKCNHLPQRRICKVHQHLALCEQHKNTWLLGGKEVMALSLVCCSLPPKTRLLDKESHLWAMHLVPQPCCNGTLDCKYVWKVCQRATGILWNLPEWVLGSGDQTRGCRSHLVREVIAYFKWIKFLVVCIYLVYIFSNRGAIGGR